MSCVFCSSPAAAISGRSAALARLGLDSNAVENSVEVYVGFLRKKLASIGSNVRIESGPAARLSLEVASSC